MASHSSLASDYFLGLLVMHWAIKANICPGSRKVIGLGRKGS